MVIFYKGEDIIIHFNSDTDISTYTKVVKFFTPFSAIKTATVNEIDDNNFTATISDTQSSDLKTGTLNIVVEFSLGGNTIISKSVQCQLNDAYQNGGARESTGNSEFSLNFNETTLQVSFETANYGSILEVTEARDEAVQAKEDAQAILETIDNLESIGILNATTAVATIESGTVTLTATPPTGWISGQSVTVQTVGNIGFAGVNFTSGTTLQIGDELRKRGTQWELLKFDIGNGTIVKSKLETTLYNLISYLETLSESIKFELDDFGNFNIIDESKNIGLQLTEAGLLRVGQIEVNNSTIDFTAFAQKSVVDVLAILIQSDANNFLSLVDSQGYAIMKNNGSQMEFVETKQEKAIVGENTLQNSTSNAFEIVDANGYIGYYIDLQGNILGETTPTTNGDLTILAPRRIYSLYNNVSANAKKYTSLYLDNLFILSDRTKNNIRFENGTDKLPVTLDTPTSNSITVSKAAKIVKGDWNEASFSFNNVTTKATSLTGTTILLPVGDSQTFGQGSGYDSYANYNDVWWMQWLSEMKKINVDNTTYGKAITVGNMWNRSRSFTYNNSTQTVSGWCNAKAGVPILSFLKHTELSTRMKTLNQGVWDLMGLGNGTGTDYTGSNTQIRAYVQVCEGQNSPTLTGALYTWLGLGTPTAIGNTITTTEQNAITTACTNRLNNPENPFFDKDKIGLHRFSINKWLSRYKTLASDGVTRLVVGSTAGSLVTNVNAYDVCLPTHVVFRFSQNELTSYTTANADLYSADMQLAITAVKEEYPTMPVALAPIAGFSSYFPELYNFINPPARNFASGQWTLQKALTDSFYTSGLGVNEDSNKAWILPLFWVQPTIEGINAEPIYESLDDNYFGIKKNPLYWKIHDDANGDTGHPGGFTHNAWAYQVLSWIAYTKTL